MVMAAPGAAGRARQVAVSGGGSCSHAVAEIAVALGEALAAEGMTIVCGGLGGVMEAVARGASRRGGVVVGVLPDYDHGSANPYVGVTIPTGLGHGRNVIVAAAGEVLIALPGGPGTLSEIAFAVRLGRYVIGLGSWGDIDGVHEVSDVAGVMAAIRSYGGEGG
jgi:uncharacterized protein (TIGR00725 family)